MQYDICLKTTSEAALIAALAPFGLTSQDEAGNAVLRTASHDHALAYAGHVQATPAEIDNEGNVITEGTYLDGEYAVLRGDEALVKQITAATLDGVEVLADAPAGCPTFGGWTSLPAVEPPAGSILNEAKIRKVAQIESKRDELLTGGFHFVHNSIDQSLQTRDESDRTNWLGVLAASTIAILAGNGEGITKIRTLSNDIITMTYIQAQELMLQVLDYQNRIMQTSWNHKDAVNAFMSDSDVQAILNYDFSSNW